MPAFGRIGKQNNRSQQALVESPGSAAALVVSAGGGASSSASASAPGPGAATTAITPQSASSSTAFNSNESFDPRSTQQQLLQQQQQFQFQQQQHQQHQQDQQQQAQQSLPPPPRIYNSPAGSPQQLHNPSSTGPSPVFDSRPKNQDFADSVSRSQSQRYPPIAPIQPHPHYGVASSSVDDLQTTLNLSSPATLQGQPPAYQHQPQHQQPPAAEQKRSARRLIRNILTGSSREHQQPHHAPQNSYDNTGGLARRPSKRVSNPPSIRTGFPVEQQQQQSVDWQPHAVHTQPSPLQGVGEVEERYFEENSNRDVHSQNPQDSQHTTIRYVQNDPETSPYEDPAFQQQPAQASSLHTSPHDQHQYSRISLDQQQQQQQQQQYQYANTQRGQYTGAPPPIFTTHLSSSQQHQNPETISQLSHESPVTDSDARSANLQSAQTSPAVNYSVQVPDLPLPTNPSPSQQIPQAQPPAQTMAPPPGGQPPNRRSQEAEKAIRGQGDAPPGPPPGYRHSQPPLPTGQSGRGSDFRPNPVPERPPQYEGSGGEQGRNSPQPSNPERDGADPDKFKELLTKYKNVKRLYFDGKTQIEHLSSQVELLQNAVANQRMSQSRTALDDSEYGTRFSRLNGAINNLSFNIRKDWKSVPQWLNLYISADALKTGKQEMTAVGRAVITRWIVEEIFNKCFHPGLNFELSRQLKDIEMNIRRLSYTLTSQEEFDALTTKVVNWRMATLDGLKPTLNSPECAENRSDFTSMATTNLTATLFQYLTDPPPMGVDGSASMIVELAVGIASNLPMESRDVAISYPLPGDTIQPNLMEIEKTPLPPIETQKPEGEGDEGRGDEGDGKDKSGNKAGRPEKPKSVLPPKDSNKVRLAGFMVVEVRGRQVLMKAPVWTLG